MRTTNQPMAKLVVLSEGMTGLAFDLKPDRTTVGRLDDNAVHIPEASVSSHHCEIIGRGSEVVVKDLNSTNGTFINGQQITEAVLKPGQILRLGQIEMRLDAGAPAASGSAPAPAPAPPATPKRTFDKRWRCRRESKPENWDKAVFRRARPFPRRRTRRTRFSSGWELFSSSSSWLRLFWRTGPFKTRPSILHGHRIR